MRHGGHCNSAVVESQVRNNRGNAYISIYHTGGVEGLLIRGNDIRPDLKIASRIAAIYVVADRNRQPFACRQVRIEGNTVGGTGIQLVGEPGAGNVVRDNRAVESGAKIVNRAQAAVADNQGFVVDP